MWTPAVGLPSSHVPGQVVMQPNANDIVLGRGVPISKYEGNIRFRELIREYKGEYMATGRHHRKQEIVAEVVQKIRERNCRFLLRIETDEEARKHGLPAGSRAWYMASEEAALSKVKQALREMESSASPKTPKFPAARSDASPRRSRKKKPPAREETAHGEEARSLADPTPQQQQPVVATPSVASAATLPTDTRPSSLATLPQGTSSTMLLPSQLGWNPSQLWPTTGLSPATMMNTLPGYQSLATVLQPPALHQPVMPFVRSLQQQSSLASLTGTPLSIPGTSLANPVASMTQWLEQQRNEAHERINQHFDGLLQEHLLQQQQQQQQEAAWRQQLEAQQSQQANAQALYLSQLGNATSNVTRGALHSLTGFNQPTFNLGNTMSQLDAVGTFAGAPLGVANGSNVGNPTQEGNGLVAAAALRTRVNAGSVHNDTESLIEALSRRSHQKPSAVSADDTPQKEGRERRRSEGDNRGATTRARLPEEEETPREATSTTGTTQEPSTPTSRARRRRRQEMDDSKPRARPQGSTTQTNTSDESEAVSSSSTSSSSSGASKQGLAALKKRRTQNS
jgi:hypothetical protein